MPLTITSPAFTAYGSIPTQFSREGDNLSPPIDWHDAPVATQSFVLIVEDPGAPKGTFRHWAAYDIPANSSNLREGAGSVKQGPVLRMGRNDFGNTQYDGPQPPPGHGSHHYHFRLFALGTPKLKIPSDSSAEDVLIAARAECLEEADVVGTFEKPGPRAER
jgi:Raf kinase inhibitor-like YbhB/YbcL family protein